jgi:hypothetical protein
MGKSLILVVLMALLSVFSTKPANAQTYQDIEDLAWNAGAGIVEVRTASGTSYGQGYLALDSTAPDGVSFYTIGHVIEDATNTWVTIDGFTEDRNRVATNRWRCDTRRSDYDTACRFFVGEEAAEAAASGDYGVMPYIRLYNHAQLEVGQYIGSPRPDTGLWTIYQITSITTTEIRIEAVFETINGVRQPLGNFCHGRSGAPGALVDYNPRTMEVTMILRNGHPISVGELERGTGRRVRDYINNRNNCYYDVVINRVDSNTGRLFYFSMISCHLKLLD